MVINKQLKARVIKLRSELTNAAITYVDVYTAKYKLISSTKENGNLLVLIIYDGVNYVMISLSG